MAVTRRQFLDLCKNSAVALGISSVCLSNIEDLFASTTAPTVLWLEGTSCSGCSVSFMNRISTVAPKTVKDVLVQTVNLRYHPTLMAAAGDTAVSIIADIVAKGPFILVVEGGIPTAFGGATCTVWTLNGSDVTMLTAVQALASKASAVMCVGTCASFGGVGAAAPNPTGVEPVSVAIGKPTINVAGCPPHPDWMIWTLAQILGNQTINVDKYGRPMYLYSNTVHMQCTRRSSPRATTFGQDTYCMRDMGCIGPYTYAHCPGGQWNNGANWCVDANSQCLGCTQPDFPQANLRS